MHWYMYTYTCYYVICIALYFLLYRCVVWVRIMYFDLYVYCTVLSCMCSRYALYFMCVLYVCVCVYAILGLEGVFLSFQHLRIFM
jgi:hypothetical protein